jgi:hypothetical protein
VNEIEFCWKVQPARERQWRRVYPSDGFDVEISGDYIFLRTNSIHAPEDELRSRAESIAKNLVRAMSDKEKGLLMPEFAHVKRTVEKHERGHIGVELEERLPAMSDEVSWTKVSYVKISAVLVEPDHDAQIDRIIDLSERARRSPSLQKILDMQSRFYVDPEKRLAPLFDVVELVETEFRGEAGAAKALGVSRKALEKLKKIANDSTIRTARHPGQAVGVLREITPEELNLCIQTTGMVVDGYAKTVPV